MAVGSIPTAVQPRSVKPRWEDIVLKLLSVDPSSYDDAPAEGIRRVLETISGKAIPRDAPIPKDLIHSIRMGTTVATNALLERKGTRHAFVVNQGFGDLLEIGYQSRPKLFELGIKNQSCSTRQSLRYLSASQSKSSTKMPQEIVALHARRSLDPGVLVKGIAGDILRIIRPLNEVEVREKLAKIKPEGIETLAICLAHSYLYPNHENRIAEIAKEMGFTHISTSSSLDINTVAVGGGSMLFWRDDLFKVGPDSAGAHPGPASYRKGGPLTVTDANLFLGRLIPDYFPKIFGPTQINADTGSSMTPLEVAHGFIDVANESMSRPIRALTEAKGFETQQNALSTLAVPAVNMRDLKAKVTEGLLDQGIREAAIEHEQYLNLRYQGTDTNFMILVPVDGDWRAALEREHLRELSFVFPRDKKVRVDDVRVRGVGKSTEVSHDNSKLVKELKSNFSEVKEGEDRITQAYFAEGGLQPTKVFRLNAIDPGSIQELVVDPVKLNIFGHRFMSIAEQMGRALQKTSVSINIKERLDFSCAIFSPDGQLVANAPHVPVHLGSMSYAVKLVVLIFQARLKALMEEYGKHTVHFYMTRIQENVEVSVRNYLKSAYKRYGSKPLKAKQFLDNGSMMKVSITIDESGFGTFDFTGTSCEMLSNMNAPPAITYSALIYTLRLLIGSDILLNQGRGQVDMKEGDRCVIHTPGGGGWGVPEGVGEGDDDWFDGGVRVVNGVNGNGINGTNGEAQVVYPRAAGSFHTFAAAQEASS
ncbi:Hydantoinase/oxoprolinase N-terminal region-domain-containing protein [Daldinia vernicosa]|uniref:Hydantoinase/oxoprolinase N-terminal region-domain-containing protein n=1 Tax=Daldinia vernicosa TaxID=114800 RepID=UPI00200794CD|nr:Hydantoinase/oxoprolinase N-terminal region-domain-containing protein [Daldinia vernicosa]KAI0853332.1 Hydantoinase/oxoprolinase N-terminal region-domain-containing protein [Daldinia vernicosa]